MPQLGDHKLLRVFAKHEPYPGHLEEVKADMRVLGPPTIEVVEYRGDYFAIEGSHRLRAAWEMGLTPIILINQPDALSPEGEEFWEHVKTTLPHYSWELLGGPTKRPGTESLLKTFTPGLGFCSWGFVLERGEANAAAKLDHLDFDYGDNCGAGG